MFRKLSKKNIKFISIPSAFTKNTGKKHWITLIKSRAIENFVIFLLLIKLEEITVKGIHTVTLQLFL